MTVGLRDGPRGTSRVLPSLFVALAGAIWLTAGCDTLFLDREPDEAHLELSSTDIDQITLVTSQWFVEVADQECIDAGNLGCPTTIQLIAADTSTVSLPFARSYPFNSRLQFFAEAFTTPPMEATLSMLVHLDDEEWYNDSRTLLVSNADGEQETLRFVYQYNVLTLP